MLVGAQEIRALHPRPWPPSQPEAGVRTPSKPFPQRHSILWDRAYGTTSAAAALWRALSPHDAELGRGRFPPRALRIRSALRTWNKGVPRI
jgi:hypothetical protein